MPEAFDIMSGGKKKRGAKKSAKKSAKKGGGAVSRVHVGPRGGKFIIENGVKRYIEAKRK